MPQDPVSDQRSDPLGTAIDDTEARLSALEKTGQFWPGMVSWTAADSAPAGWLIADGSDFDGDRYAALAAALGSTTLPDLRNKFPVGAGDTYALLTTGGAATHTLTGAESGVPAHTHPGGTTGAGSAHSHGSPGNQFALSDNASQVSVGSGLARVTGVTANTATEAAHTHSTPTVAVNTAANAASPHSVLNPYVALTPLIHI